MTLRAFMDDSYTKGGVFVLSGFVASVSEWASFSEEWVEMLELLPLNAHGKRVFKMSEVRQSEQTMSDIIAFYKIIQRNVRCGLTFSFNLRDVWQAKQRIQFPNVGVDWHQLNSNFAMAFSLFFSMPEHHWDKVDELTGGGEIEFFFDDQSEKKFIRDGWEEFVRNRRADVRDRYASEGKFEDDEEFLPLQAADFSANLARLMDENPGFVPDFVMKHNTKSMPYLKLSVNADNIAESLLINLRRALGSQALLCDLKVAFSNDAPPP